MFQKLIAAVAGWKGPPLNKVEKAVRAERVMARTTSAKTVSEAGQYQRLRVTAVGAVQGACEILGFDPLYLANEGRFISFVAPSDADRAVSILRAHPLGSGAVIAGRVLEGPSSLVTMKSRIGATRIVDMFTGEQLPRIC